MAGDWIKMRGNLWDDPRVSRLVDETDSSEAAVIGSLYWLWATADQHTADGVMPGLTLKGIDRKTGVKGFAQALCDINWLEAQGDGVRIVGFEDHNGASAKSRLDTAKRVAKHRAKEPVEKVRQEDGPYKRLSIPSAVAALILERDGNQCVYCHRSAGAVGPTETEADGILHMDHVIPLSKGGACDESNLVTACRKCNMKKGNRNPDECGFDWPLQNGKRIGNTKPVTESALDVTGALAREREEKIREEKTHTPPPAADQPAGEPDGSVCVLICKAMRDAGIGDTDASDAGLAVLVGKGADAGMFAAAAPMAVKNGKGFAYALGIVKAKMLAAAALADVPLAVPAARPASVDVGRVTVPESLDVAATQRLLAERAATPRASAPPELVERLAKRRGTLAAGAGA